jgi:hypothetical protein
MQTMTAQCHGLGVQTEQVAARLPSEVLRADQPGGEVVDGDDLPAQADHALDGIVV